MKKEKLIKIDKILIKLLVNLRNSRQLKILIIIRKFRILKIFILININKIQLIQMDY